METFAELAMDVIRDDWQERKVRNPSRFTQEKIAKKMHISRSQFATSLADPKDPTVSFISTYAIAVTGLMGPDAGDEKEPVGTTWIAVGNKNKTESPTCTHRSKPRCSAPSAC